MAESIVLPDDVVSYAQQLLVPGGWDLPPIDGVRMSIERIFREGVAGTVGDRTYVGVVGGDDQPHRHVTVVVREEAGALTATEIQVDLTRDPDHDAVDPVTYYYGRMPDGERQLIFDFSGRSRAAFIDMRTSRPGSLWAARLIECWGPGEEYVVPADLGDALEINAARGDGKAECVVIGRSVLMMGETHVTTKRLDVATPLAGFFALAPWLPPCKGGTTVQRQPDSRLR